MSKDETKKRPFNILEVCRQHPTIHLGVIAKRRYQKEERLTHLQIDPGDIVDLTLDDEDGEQTRTSKKPRGKSPTAILRPTNALSGKLHRQAENPSTLQTELNSHSILSDPLIFPKAQKPFIFDPEVKAVIVVEVQPDLPPVPKVEPTVVLKVEETNEKLVQVDEIDDPPYRRYTARTSTKLQIKHKQVLKLPKLDLNDSNEIHIGYSTGSDILSVERQGRLILKHRWSHQGISCESRVKGRQLSGKFQFIEDYVISQKAMKQISNKHVSFGEFQCAYRGTAGKRDYKQDRNGMSRLTNEFLRQLSQDATMSIRECNVSCGCTNRVVQDGRGKVSLQIFETRLCGFGVRTLQNLRAGQFVELYLGEIITQKELERREDAADEDTPSYILSLDHFGTDLHIDGSNFGSVTRFINHSCSPNCTTVPVVLPTDTKAIYHVAFFTISDIPANTELTIDYDPSVKFLEGTELDPSVVRCRCGSQNCRQRLWAPGKRRRGRRNILNKPDD